MQQAIVVRKMSPAEIEPVTSIYAEVLHPGYISFSELAEGKAEGPGKLSDQASALFRQQLFEMLASDRYGLFVAIVDERIVGFAIASLHQANAGHIECWLDDLGVKREWQANGIGAALTEQMLAWGREGNARYFLAEASVNKAAAPGRLLEHYGFQPLAVVYWRER